MQLQTSTRITLMVCATVMILGLAALSWASGSPIDLGEVLGTIGGAAGGILAGLGMAGGPSPWEPGSSAPASRSPRRRARGGLIGLMLFGLALVALPSCGAPCQWAAAIVDSADAGADELAESAPDEGVARAAGIVGTVADLGRVLIAFCEGVMTAVDGPADAAVRTLPTAQDVVCPVGGD